MSITRKQEIWALALSVERKHCDQANRYIADRIASFEASGPPEAVSLWRQVAHRHAQLTPPAQD